MQKTTLGDNYTPNTPQQIDWNAVDYLQKKCLTANDGFKIDSMEYALNRLLEKPNRLATGEQLAKDLYRDGKRVTISCRAIKGNSLKHKKMYVAQLPKEDFQSEIEEQSIHAAIQLVKSSFQKLPKKEALAIYIRTIGQTPEIINQYLGVTIRQYRNLLRQARKSLHSIVGFSEAYFLLYIHSEKEDIMAFFSKLIQEMV